MRARPLSSPVLLMDDNSKDESNGAARLGMDLQPRSRAAPWSNVPPVAIVCVEHPFIVKNIDKAIETLGGHNDISRVGVCYLWYSFTFSR